MSNAYDYCCPRCHSADYIAICAVVSVRLTSTGTIGDAASLGPNNWCSESGAGCGSCDYEGIVSDFKPPETASVISIQSWMRRRPIDRCRGEWIIPTALIAPPQIYGRGYLENRA